MGKDAPVIGEFTVWDIDANGLWTPRFRARNTLMTSWGFAAAKLFGEGDRRYRISKVYLEYENVADPDDVVSAPAYDENDGLDYYQSLVAPKDYLRVAVRGTPAISIASGYESYFTDGETGNVLTIEAQSVGTEGRNGLEYSNAANSKIYGLAVVAAPVDADPTQDVIVCRAYYPSNKQKVQPASGQTGVTWDLKFLPLV